MAETKSFKYLGALFNSEASCDEEVKSRLAIARQRMGELVPIWKSRTMSNRLKARLIKALVWPTVTYGLEAWTLNRELEGNIGAFEMQCYRRCMRISYTEHVTNDDLLRRGGQDLAGSDEITETEILRPRIKAQQPRKRYHSRHHAGHEETGWSKETAVAIDNSRQRKAWWT